MVGGIRVPGVFWGGRTELPAVSGAGIEKVPDLPKCQVPASKKYRTYRRVRYRYRKNTEVTDTCTLGLVIEGKPVPGVVWGRRTELTEVLGTGIESSYRTLPNFGYGYH